MAKYYTTTEELTSIANAIRAKTGNNSALIYPSDFINEIGNIDGKPVNEIGINPQLVTTTHDLVIKLSDTDWANVTLSTDQAQLLSFPNDDDVTVNFTDSSVYIIQMCYYTDYQYQNNNDNEILPRMLYTSDFFIRTKMPTLTKQNNTISYNGVTTGNIIQVCDVGINTQNQLILVNNTNYHSGGIYCNGPQSAFYQDYLKVRPGSIMCRLYSSCFPQTTADLIDADKTKIYIKIQVYKYDSLLLKNYTFNTLQAWNEMHQS